MERTLGPWSRLALVPQILPALDGLTGRLETGAPATGLAFERHFGIPYPSVSDPDDLVAARFGAIAPTATPSTYIFYARGRIAWAYFGATTYSHLELAVTDVAGP